MKGFGFPQAKKMVVSHLFVFSYQSSTQPLSGTTAGVMEVEGDPKVGEGMGMYGVW